MGWASHYVQKLRAGETVAGNEYLHIVTDIRPDQCQIGNNRALINGWIGPESIYGKCIEVAT